MPKRMAPPIIAFSRPVSSWSKPAPSARIGATRPLTCTLPSVGKVMPADNLQERRFARAIAADNADPFAAANLEADVPQYPMLMVKLLPVPEDRLFELIVAPHIELERLADPVAADDNLR